MKRILLGLAALLGFALPAQADLISVNSDPTSQNCFGSCCFGTPVLFPEITSVYLIHKFTTGATASHFKVQDASGLVTAGSASSYATVGDFYSGVTVDYGSCLAGSFEIARLDYYWMGEPMGCTNQIRIVADPGAPQGQQLVVTNCSSVVNPVIGGVLSFGGLFCCAEAPVKSSTWGSVKALYR